jgi:hypothetical protein
MFFLQYFLLLLLLLNGAQVMTEPMFNDHAGNRKKGVS